MTKTDHREVHGGPSQGPQWLVVTTTSRRDVRRHNCVLTDLQQIELLSILMAKTTDEICKFVSLNLYLLDEISSSASVHQLFDFYFFDPQFFSINSYFRQENQNLERRIYNSTLPFLILAS